MPQRAEIGDLSSRNIVILADDLSGAADCAIACAGGRADALVALEAADLPFGAGVLGIDLDTRRMPAAEAAQCVSSFMSQDIFTPTLYFKKCDSTLRGHIAMELAAALRAVGRGKRSVGVFAPAYPGMGRTMQDGRSFLHGEALEDSELWRLGSVEGSKNIAELFNKSELRVSLIKLRDIRGGRLHALLCEHMAGHDVIACDAKCDSDLDLIAHAAHEVSGSVDFPLIWVGSGGLAHALGRLAMADRPNFAPAAGLSKKMDRLMFVVGSFSNVSRRQIDFLVSHRPLNRVEISSWELLQDYGNAVLKLRGALENGRDIALVIAAEAVADLALGGVLAEAMARLVVMHAEDIGGLVVTGGETARAVLVAFQIKTLRLIEEIEPGIPLAVSHDSRRLPVITKAGAFGSEAAFLNCHAALKQIPIQ